jgi:hypothetical protein
MTRMSKNLTITREIQATLKSDRGAIQRESK